jgi:hypothetical protein
MIKENEGISVVKHVGKAGSSARRLANKRALVLYGTLLTCSSSFATNN